MTSVLATILMVVCTGTTLAQNNTTTSSLKLTRTFNSIGIELLFIGDDDANATATLEFKKRVDSVYRKGLDLWRTASDTAPGRAFYGSAVLLESNTLYDVRVTVSDPTGVTGAVVTGSITTRAEKILPPASLIPTHYVRVDGNDSNPGTSDSASGAWKTLGKAITAAPANAVVQVGPGYFASPSHSTIRTLPITLIAKYPAVAYNSATKEMDLINAGNRSVIVPGNGTTAFMTGPAGSVAPFQNVWTKETPDGNPAHVVYRWAGSPATTGAKTMGVAPTLAALPQRVANWRDGIGDITSPAQFATKVYNNLTYNYGFWRNGTDIWVRLPPDTRKSDGTLTSNPNDVWVTLGEQQLLNVKGDDVRISGFEGRGSNFGFLFNYDADRGIVDHCFLTGGFLGVRIVGNKSVVPHIYPQDHVIQYNRFEDTHLWGLGSAHVIPWNFVKINILGAGGVSMSSTDVGSFNESSAIQSAGHHTVIRHNTIEGTFNGISDYMEGYDRYATMGTDIHDNIMRKMCDDPLEPETHAINWRIWNNQLSQTATMLSTGPAEYGPIYFFRNTVWQVGGEGGGDDPSASLVNGRFHRPYGLGFKYSGSNKGPKPLIYWIHNTFWTNYQDPFVGYGSPGGSNAAGGFGFPPASADCFYWRNNIVRASGYVMTVDYAAQFNEDYNIMVTDDVKGRLPYADPYAPRGFLYCGIDYDETNASTGLTAYRTASGQGKNSNKRGNSDLSFHHYAAVDAELRNPFSGDLRLAVGSSFIDAGTPIPNISDVGYLGSAPDLGAVEYVTPSVLSSLPAAPSGLSVSIISESQLSLTWEDNSMNETGFEIERKMGASGTYGWIATVSPGVKSYRDVGLIPGTQYFYRVRARSGSGSSGFTLEDSATTPVTGTTPATPSSLTATGVSSNFVSLAWADTSNNETNFSVERRTLTGAYSTVVTLGANVTTFKNSGLPGNMEYYYRVKSVSAGVSSAGYSNEVSVKTLLSPGTPPAAPSGLAVSAMWSTRIDLSWVDNATNETAFKIERSGGASTSYVQIATVAAGARVFQNSGLTPGTQFSYRVRATNGSGDSAYTSIVTATTPGGTSGTVPAAPSNLTASVVSSSQIRLQWSDQSTNETGFRIDRKVGATGTYGQLATVGANVVSFANTGLTAGTTYFYRVCAINGTGISPFSNEVNATSQTSSVVGAIDGGTYHSVVLKDDGTIYTWGDGSAGQLGNGAITNSLRPVSLGVFGGATEVVAGRNHNFVLMQDGALLGWGYNVYGAIGDGTQLTQRSPVSVAISSVKAIAAGQYHSVAVKTDGSVWCWGYGTSGQIGNGGWTNVITPRAIAGIGNIISVAAGGNHSVALQSDGSVWTWGENHFGQLGINSTNSRATPFKVAGLTGVTRIAAGSFHTVALLGNGTMKAWGKGSNGALGYGGSTDCWTPVAIPSLSNIVEIAAGRAHTLALRADGTLWSVGYNVQGQLGDGTQTTKITPVQVSGLSGIIGIEAGDTHSMALQNGGAVFTWGINERGQLGNGTTNLSPVRVQVSGLDLISTP
jgi:alpha-tubulin suppressor-like RCC1 family protein/fibronectin type 3 domain-containing protein